MTVNEFSKQFITILVRQNIFLEEDSHAALGNKMGHSLFLGLESKSLGLTSTRLNSLVFSEAEWACSFCFLGRVLTDAVPKVCWASSERMLLGQAETGLEVGVSQDTCVCPGLF